VLLTLMRLNYKIEEYEVAFDLYQKASNIAENSLPKSHPTLCMVYMSLGELLEEKGSVNEAMEYYIKGLKCSLDGNVKCNEAVVNRARECLTSAMKQTNKVQVLAEMIDAHKDMFSEGKENIEKCNLQQYL